MLLTGGGSLQGALKNDRINPVNLNVKSARVPSEITVSNDNFRSGLVRILALRVEFAEDTLSTTTGDGSFEYELVDTAHYDPPPHDSTYFADHLEFLRFYWGKMSAGALDLNWDIYPSGMRAAYQLPKKMWQYNYNSSDEQLDFGLAQLFRDAVYAADDDNSIHWQDYDLVIIFHAGAGAEFDLGYTTTPHDIPSAWIIAEDLDTLGLSQGVPVDGGTFLVNQGLILPETETHEEVQISMAGVIVSLFGHWLGLPALYDNDTDVFGNAGRPVVGKWSLMDRGFGNFYGSIPGQLDAWSRSYMGWLEPTVIKPGNFAISALGFEQDTTSEAYRIPINDKEYYLLSCRARDPENDSIAVAYDRDGRRMVYNDDYSVTADPGFRVPVRIDNLDFDAPGSGILIWHVDESLKPLIAERRFNSVDELRGLDLEEADGAQDIGQDYPFLTPGYGTDYGIFTDAWYHGNEHHQSSNQGRAVSFNDNSYPASWSNSGAFTHITINNFSRIDTVMSFSFSNRNLLFSQDIVYHHTGSGPRIGIGNFDDNPDDDEIYLDGGGRFLIDGSGEILLSYGEAPLRAAIGQPLIRDINGDQKDDIFTIDFSLLGERITFYILESLPVNGYATDSFFGLDLPIDSTRSDFNTFATFGGRDGIESLLYTCITTFGTTDKSYLRLFDASLEQTSALDIDQRVLSMHRLGTAESDTVLLITDDGDMLIWHHNELESLGADHFNSDVSLVASCSQPTLADFDGSGLQDLFMVYEDNTFLLFRDIIPNGWQDVVSNRLAYSNFGDFSIPVDLDYDGAWEILTAHGNSLNGFKTNGVLTDKFPRNRVIPPNSEDLTINDAIIADLTGNGRLDYMTIEKQSYSNNISKYLLSGKTYAGYDVPGFPITLSSDRIWPPQVKLCQLDSLPDLELLVVSSNMLSAYDLNFKGEKSDIWWGQAFRDNDHSNAIWEPGQSFNSSSAAPLIQDGQCYVWPNPARDFAYFRYTLNVPAMLNINIYDITGEKIETLTGAGDAGITNEIIWTLNEIPRGGYIAVVEASSDGKTEKKKIKVAVLK